MIIFRVRLASAALSIRSLETVVGRRSLRVHRDREWIRNGAAEELIPIDGFGGGIGRMLIFNPQHA